MDPFTGEIRIFAGNFAPQGWLACNGALLQISEFQALYSLIGTAYGGDGRVTFGLPDMRGRLVVSQGQGHNLSNRVIGQTFGSETVTLTTAQMTPHTHTFNASTSQATATSPAAAVHAAPPPSGSDPRVTFVAPAAPGSAFELDTLILEPAGGGQYHLNMMPALALMYIICWQGTYPPRP